MIDDMRFTLGLGIGEKLVNRKFRLSGDECSFAIRPIRPALSSSYTTDWPLPAFAPRQYPNWPDKTACDSPGHMVYTPLGL